MSAPSHAYLGTKACGCFGFIACDMPDLARDIARDTGWLIKRGGEIERLSLEDAKAKVRDLPATCEVCR